VVRMRCPAVCTGGGSWPSGLPPRTCHVRRGEGFICPRRNGSVPAARRSPPAVPCEGGPPVTDDASPPPRPDPTDTGPGLDLASGTVGIDPDDTEVVPDALTGLVTSARATYRAMRANGCYPAIMAVGAVEDTVATLARITSHLELYVGDYS